MNRLGKIITGSVIMVLILSMAGFLLHKSVVSWRFSNAAEAAGSMPYQIGLTNAIVIQCTISCTASCCVGGALCSTLDVGRCSMYSDVSGSMAGGMGTMALFSQMAIGQAGLSSGGQLIAGGMSMTQMDQGVLASGGGCSGCTAKAGTVDKIFALLEKVDKFIIAGFKGK